MRPLEGLFVLDFSTLLPGPFATLLLAEAGAEVVKIERPGSGEEMRGRTPKWGTDSANFALLNRGKRSVALDLKNPAERACLQPLVERADVIVEQFRPGVMARLGLDYDAVAKVNPTVIYCSISGYGQSGSSPSGLRLISSNSLRNPLFSISSRRLLASSSSMRASLRAISPLLAGPMSSRILLPPIRPGMHSAAALRCCNTSAETGDGFVVVFRAGCLRPWLSVRVETFGISERRSSLARTAPTVLSSTFAILAVALFDLTGLAFSNAATIWRFCSAVRWRR